MDYSLLYETFQYGKQYAWTFVVNEILPKLKENIERMKRYNKAYVESQKKLEEEKSPFYCRPFSPPTDEYFDEERERIAHDQFVAYNERNY